MGRRETIIASLIVLLVLLVLVRSRLKNQYHDHNAPTIKLPLTRSIVTGAGKFGQPAINYYAPVSIGTPERPFKIQVDTNLGGFLVLFYDKARVQAVLHYDGGGYLSPNSSTSHKISSKTSEITYQQCKLVCNQYQDLINLGSAQSQLDIEIKSCLAVKSLQASCLANFKALEVDGFLGLGPSYTSSSLLHNMKRAELIEDLHFSFWFNSAHDARDGGVLTLGGADPYYYTGRINWHYISSYSRLTSQWIINLQFVTLDGKFVSPSCQAIISTGVSDIYGPMEEVSLIYSLLGVTGPLGRLPSIDCKRVHQLPTLTFFIDQVPYPLLPTNYVRRVDPNDIHSPCYVAILPSKSPTNLKQWILGSNFLSAYYSVFDMDRYRVGFASMRA